MKIKEPENYSKKGKGKTKLGKQPVSAAENKGTFVCIPSDFYVTIATM